MRHFLLCAILLTACGSETTSPVVGPTAATVLSATVTGNDITLRVRNKGAAGQVRATAWIRPAPLSTNTNPRQTCPSIDQPIAANGDATITLRGCGEGNGGGPVGWVWIISSSGDTSGVTECYALPGVPQCPVGIRAP